MGKFLAHLIDEVYLGTPHIVGPDVGTAASLFAAASHPELIAGVVVGTGGAAVPLQLGEPLRSWVLDPGLEKYRAMDPRAIVNAAADGIAGSVPDDIRADYLECYDGDRFVESMRYVRRYPEELPQLAELLPQIETPVTIINGRNDPVVPLANLARAVASGGTGRALQAVPPADRDRVVNAAHHAFVTGFNTIAMVSVAVAAIGAVAGYTLVRSRDFAGPGAPVAAPPEPTQA